MSAPVKAETSPTHVVMKGFPVAGGRFLGRGTKVYALDFLNLVNLEKRGFLARLPGCELDPHESKTRAHGIRERHRLCGKAFAKAQAQLKHRAEVERENARSRAERALAKDLGKIGEQLEAEIASALARLQKEHGIAA